MKKNVVIHIGIHKTASTFLQTHLLPHFPETTLVTRPYTQFNKAFNKLQYADDTLYDKCELEIELIQIKTRNLILSDENFSGKLFFYNAINRTRTANRLHELFPNATIVIVLRNQMDFIMSSYNHYVKGVHKGTKAIHKFIKHDSKPYININEHKANAAVNNYTDYLYYNTDDTCLNLEVLKYSKLIQLYQSLFPKVKVLLFEDIIKAPKLIVDTFEKELGVRSHFDYTKFGSKENSSLDDADLYAQLKLNQTKSNNQWLRNIYKLYFKFYKKSMQGLDKEFIRNYYREDNLKLSEMYSEINFSRHKKYF